MGKAGFTSPCDGAEGQSQGMGDLAGTPTRDAAPGGTLNFSKPESPGGFMGMLRCFLSVGERSGTLGCDGDVAAASPAPNRCFSARAVKSLPTERYPSAPQTCCEPTRTHLRFCTHIKCYGKLLLTTIFFPKMGRWRPIRPPRHQTMPGSRPLSFMLYSVLPLEKNFSWKHPEHFLGGS